MSRAREFADLAGSADAGGLTGRNLIINGGMQVFQRGTTKTFTSNDNSNYYVADRWGQFVDINEGTGSLSVTISQSTDTPAGQGFMYSLKGATTPSSFAKAGSDNLALFTHKVETYTANRLGWGESGAKPATLSYWIKSDTTGTGTLQIRLPDSSVVSGAADGNFYTKFTINQANTWEYKTHLIPANTTDGWRKTSSNLAMHIHWYFGSNQSDVATEDAWFRSNNHGTPHSDNTFDFLNNAGEAYLTGVQLEVGDKATPFEHRSYEDELLRCQRFFYRWGYLDSTGGQGTIPLQAYFTSGGGCDIHNNHPVEMRAKPSISTNGTWSTSNVASFSGRFHSRQGFSVRYNVTADGNAYIHANSADDYFDISAEL